MKRKQASLMVICILIANICFCFKFNTLFNDRQYCLLTVVTMIEHFKNLISIPNKKEMKVAL